MKFQFNADIEHHTGDPAQARERDSHRASIDLAEAVIGGRLRGEAWSASKVLRLKPKIVSGSARSMRYIYLGGDTGSVDFWLWCWAGELLIHGFLRLRSGSGMYLPLSFERRQY